MQMNYRDEKKIWCKSDKTSSAFIEMEIQSKSKFHLFKSLLVKLSRFAGRIFSTCYLAVPVRFSAGCPYLFLVNDELLKFVTLLISFVNNIKPI